MTRKKFVLRKRHAKGFRYISEDTGKPVTNKATKAWITTLRIPPAWQSVRIDLDRDAKIHVSGRDQQNRKQYIYNCEWTTAAAEKKFQRTLRFAQKLPMMRRVTGQHLRRKPIDRKAVLACMTRMLDEAYFRPGNKAYTQTHETFGLTTLRRRHLHPEGDLIAFEYIGKSHKLQHREITDKRVLAILQDLAKMPGYDLFDVTLPDGTRHKFTANELNNYISEIMGEDFTAKDFRTWAGTLLMAVALNQLGPAVNATDTKSKILDAVKQVATELGNTPAVCRENYIHPHVITQYESGRTLDYFKKQLKSRSLRSKTLDERATLELLQRLIIKEAAA